MIVVPAGGTKLMRELGSGQGSEHWTTTFFNAKNRWKSWKLSMRTCEDDGRRDYVCEVVWLQYVKIGFIVV